MVRREVRRTDFMVHGGKNMSKASRRCHFVTHVYPVPRHEYLYYFAGKMSPESYCRDQQDQGLSWIFKGLFKMSIICKSVGLIKICYRVRI